jgi:hypothetical protein
LAEKKDGDGLLERIDEIGTIASKETTTTSY